MVLSVLCLCDCYAIVKPSSYYQSLKTPSSIYYTSEIVSQRISLTSSVYYPSLGMRMREKTACTMSSGKKLISVCSANSQIKNRRQQRQEQRQRSITLKNEECPSKQITLKTDHKLQSHCECRRIVPASFCNAICFLLKTELLSLEVL